MEASMGLKVKLYAAIAALIGNVYLLSWLISFSRPRGWFVDATILIGMSTACAFGALAFKLGFDVADEKRRG
jgi:hypothetical protein